jgi:hypothetical protein
MGVRPKKRLWTVMLLVFAPGTVWSQANGAEPPANNGVQSSIPQTESRANYEPQAVETSPTPGLDQSSLEPLPVSSRSHLLAGIHVSEGAESDPDWVPGDSSQVSSVTNLLGNLSLLKVRHRSQTAIDYIGGDTLYSGYGGLTVYNQPFQKLNADQSLLWSKGQLAVKDSFDYIGKGDFAASSFGGAGADVPPDTGVSNFFGASQSGVVQEPYITNALEATISQALAPRSSAYLAGAYSITDYFGNGESLFNSRQASAQAGYSYQLSRLADITAVYGYQKFEFPRSGAGNADTNSAQFVYQRRISGRVDFVLGAGPEIITLSGGASGKTRQITTTAQASLRYRWVKSTINISGNRLVTAGSGYFAGGISDIATFSVDRNISRSWRTALNAGYSRVSAVGLTAAGTSGSSYQNWFAGTAVQRRLGRSMSAFASYQFNDQSFGSCVSTGCTPAVHPQVFLLGFDWYIRPVALD